MTIEGFDLLEWAVPVLTTLGGIGALGVLVSSYTKTEKDDKFFKRWMDVLRRIGSFLGGRTPSA